MPFHGARADEQLRRYLRVRQPIARQSGDLGFLGGEVVHRVRPALTNGFAGGQEFVTGTFGERLESHVVELLMGDPQLLAGVDATALAPEPFAVHEVRTGGLYAE